MAYTEVTLPLVHVVDVIFDHAHHDGSSLIRQPKARQAFKEFYRQVQRQCYQKTPQLCLEIGKLKRTLKRECAKVAK